jgi:DNA-binding NarL/FixJ family response regulator
MTPIRVALVDDHPVVLAGITSLLRAAPDILLVGEATSGEAALRLIADAAPDVAVIDISLPDLNGLDLAHRLAERCPAVRLLALTVHEDRAYVQPLLQAGARGYLLKRSAAEDLPRAIRAVAAGGVYLDPAVADKALPPGTGPGAGASPDGEPLSQREQDVLRLTAQGFTNKEIAARLEVSVKTVETYKARASEKLGLRTRAEIVRYGARHGWLDGLGAP